MSAAEFVSMTLAFVKHMHAMQARGDEAGYAEAHADLTHHLHDSWNGCRLKAFADGMAYQKERMNEAAK